MGIACHHFSFFTFHFPIYKNEQISNIYTHNHL